MIESYANFVAPSPEKENLNGKWVEVSNNGTADANLTGWILEDAQNHTYTFPDFSLKAGAKVTIRTGMGNDNSTDLFWNKNSSIWNNNGDLATLMDASGNIVALSRRIPRCLKPQLFSFDPERIFLSTENLHCGSRTQ